MRASPKSWAYASRSRGPGVRAERFRRLRSTPPPRQSHAAPFGEPAADRHEDPCHSGSGEGQHQRHQRHVAPRHREQQSAEHRDPDDEDAEHQCFPAALPGEHGEARDRQRQHRVVEGDPAAGPHRRARAAAPDVPHLRRDHARVRAGLLAYVLAEVLAADPRQRSVTLHVRVLARDLVEQVLHLGARDLLVGDLGLAGEPLDQLALGGQLAPLARQVGRHEQRLAAAGRDGHEAVEDDQVAHRPRRQHQRVGGHEHHRGEHAQADAALGASRGRG